MGYYEEHLSDEQREIYTRMVNGENIFLTGNAGTGKSFLVEAYSEYCQENSKNILKTAPTGVSACNINGVTLHRQFLLKTDVRSMLEKSRLPKRTEEALSCADTILIDEISMVRIDVFDKVMSYIEMENRKRRSKGKKAIQLILVGDFFQLAPVITPEDRTILEEYYGKPIGDGFAFQSKYWKANNVQMCKLTEIKRQAGEEEFCLALDQCKIGSRKCLEYFNKNTAKGEQNNAIWLCGKNNTAFNKNKEYLGLLKGKEYKFPTKYAGNVTAKDRLCDEEFICKVGARVLMTVNSKDYQNGSMGTIVSIEDNKIIVAIDSYNADGTEALPIEAEVEKNKFCKYEYEPKEKVVVTKLPDGTEKTELKKELVLKETGYAEQFPMKLGYAITVHKSQGQTYRAMNFVPEIFQNGQLYVALSRCKSPDMLYIKSPLYSIMLRTSQEVISYYNSPETYSFFGDENDVISVQVAKKTEKAVLLLNELYKENQENVIEIMNFLETLRKKENKQLSFF